MTTSLTFKDNTWHLRVGVRGARPADRGATISKGYLPAAAALKLGVSRQAIHNAINRGTLEAYTIDTPSGRRLHLIPASALEEFRKRPRRRAALEALSR